MAAKKARKTKEWLAWMFPSGTRVDTHGGPVVVGAYVSSLIVAGIIALAYCCSR